MTGRVLIKPGVEFTFAPAGLSLLGALKATARTLALDLTITSGSDGAHSGPGDPHKLGEAYDVRSHDLSSEQKQAVIVEWLRQLQSGAYDAPMQVNGGWATAWFYAFLEHPGGPDEHIHAQRRKGKAFTIEDFLAA